MYDVDEMKDFQYEIYQVYQNNKKKRLHKIV